MENILKRVEDLVTKMHSQVVSDGKYHTYFLFKPSLFSHAFSSCSLLALWTE